MYRIVPQDNELYSIAIAGCIVEIDLTHAQALAALNVYEECAEELVE